MFGGSASSVNNILHPRDHVFRRPKTIRYQWVVTAAFRAPDGVKKRVYLINGRLSPHILKTVYLIAVDEFPGPTIEARSGDTIVVEVVNKLQNDEGVSMHWHGLHMTGILEKKP
jgi:FtsP/CotA-like multicopper oxidase with cupredoxin domain